MKEALIKFKAVKAKLFLKEAKSMHYEVVEKNIDNYNAGLALGLNEIESTILANRTNDIENYIKYLIPRFKDIMDYTLLKDIDVAADVIQKHMAENGHILLVTDYDVDKQCILKLK